MIDIILIFYLKKSYAMIFLNLNPTQEALNKTVSFGAYVIFIGDTVRRVFLRKGIREKEGKSLKSG